MLVTLALLAAYHHAWITHNAEQVAQLFTENAVYHPHPYGRKTYALQPTSTMYSSG